MAGWKVIDHAQRHHAALAVHWHDRSHTRACTRRVYFLLPTLASAKSIPDGLMLARIGEHHIHIVAREGTPLEDLPEAGFAQRSGPGVHVSPLDTRSGGVFDAV